VQNTEPEFLIPSEVEKITRLRDPTRKRMEKRGLFPARIHIAPRRIAWRCADIQTWVADPEGWPKRVAANGGRDEIVSKVAMPALTPGE
jgi:predicted DNA-binding transcriptional regulator AlpA